MLSVAPCLLMACAWLSLGAALNSKVARTTFEIKELVQPTFNVLPKTQSGLLGAPAMRYMMHTYFSQEHGWVIKGLGLRDRDPAPHIGTLVEDYSFDQAVDMITRVESLIFNDAAAQVKGVYEAHGVEESSVIDTERLDEMLSFYVTSLSLSSGPRDFTEASFNPSTLLRFAHSQTQRQDATFGKIANEIAQEYHKLQAQHCQSSKATLVALDDKAKGRVPLADFRRLVEEGLFTESEETLRQLGALDESSAVFGSQVLIANYILSGPGCVGPSPYHAVCCMNECEALMARLEHEIQEPVATVEHVLKLAEGLSATNISEVVASRLRDTATMHGGKVPLHGRLFGQWMHYAFPRECPWPREAPAGLSIEAGNNRPATPSEWLQDGVLIRQEAKEAAGGEWELRHPIQTIFDKSKNASIPSKFWEFIGIERELQLDEDLELHSVWPEPAWLLKWHEVLTVVGATGTLVGTLILLSQQAASGFLYLREVIGSTSKGKYHCD